MFRKATYNKRAIKKKAHKVLFIGFFFKSYKLSRILSHIYPCLLKGIFSKKYVLLNDKSK